VSNPSPQTKKNVAITPKPYKNHVKFNPSSTDLVDDTHVSERKYSKTDFRANFKYCRKRLQSFTPGE